MGVSTQSTWGVPLLGLQEHRGLLLRYLPEQQHLQDA